MKFSCNPQDLANALAIVNRAVSIKPSIPILSGIKIVAEGTTLSFFATDTDLFIQTKLKATVILEGEIVVNGKFFTDFIKKISNVDEITVELVENDHIQIVYGDNSSLCQVYNVETFPFFTDVLGDTIFKIKESELKRMLEKTLFCLAVDDSRPILKGCFVKSDGDKLRLTCLDGFRMAICRTDITELKGEVEVIVPGKYMKELAGIATDSEEETTINIYKDNIMFDFGYTKITMRTMIGQYLRYEEITKRPVITKISIKKSDLISVIDRSYTINRYSKEGFIIMDIDTVNNVMSLNSKGEDGTLNEKLPIECIDMCKDVNIAFRNKNIIDVLAKINEDYIQIGFREGTGPAEILPLEGNAYEYIVLPVRRI